MSGAIRIPGRGPRPGETLGSFRFCVRPIVPVPVGSELFRAEEGATYARDSAGMLWRVVMRFQYGPGGFAVGVVEEGDGTRGYPPDDFVWHEGEDGDGFWGPPPAPSEPPTA